MARKLAPPLVTLLGGEPEVQYVALRSIALVVQRHPGVLANEVKVRRSPRTGEWCEWVGGWVGGLSNL
jgi:hypothetical protein